MSQLPDFTIALPVYNGGELLKECINSILNQSYPNFILQVYNSFDNTDGSTGYLHSIDDERLQIIQADKKLTIEENWGRFHKFLDTEFGTIIGQDDLLDPEFLMEIKKLITQYPGASLWHTRYKIIDAHNNVTGNSKLLPLKEQPTDYLQSILTISAETVGTGYVFRCADYRQVGGIPAFPDLLFADFALWFRLASFGYKVNLPKELFSFRIHESTTSRASAKKYLDGFKCFIDFLFREAEENVEVKQTMHKCLNSFLVFYSEVMALRIIKSPRNFSEVPDARVNEVLAYCRQVSNKANIGESPTFTLKTKLAAMIDDNLLLRKGFILLRAIYPKPIWR